MTLHFKKCYCGNFTIEILDIFKIITFFIVEYYITGPEITNNSDQILAYFSGNEISGKLRNDSF